MPNDQYTLAKHGPEYHGAGQNVVHIDQVERILLDARTKERKEDARRLWEKRAAARELRLATKPKEEVVPTGQLDLFGSDDVAA